MSTQAEPPRALPPEAAAIQLLFQCATGYMVSAALQVVVKLGIVDRMGDGSAPTRDLAQAASVNEDALYRVLRALASVGLFEEPTPRSFKPTLAGQMLRKGPHSFYDMGLWITSPFHFRVSSEMLAFSRLLSTNETAVRDTPACLATSFMVTPRGLAVPLLLGEVVFAIECSSGRR